MTVEAEKELFENAFYFLIEALRVLSIDAEAQCEQMGDFNVPWEIQTDVTRGCQVVLLSQYSELTHEQTEMLQDLVFSLQQLPREAIAPHNTVTSNHEGSISAMRHPAWAKLRVDATEILQMLESAIRHNEMFFQEN